MDRIDVTYLVPADPAQIEKAARYIAIEQTVEIPEHLIEADIDREVVGKVQSISPSIRPLDGLKPPQRAFEVRISYAAALSGGQFPHLLNLIYGNISIQKDIRLIELELPESFLKTFRGPNYGIDGLRRALGVYGRPLLATALKPNGASVDRLAAYARDFALGGGDIIKDDQNLIDASVHDFWDRIRRCQAAVDEANSKTGRKTMYCPILTAPQEELDRRMELVESSGVAGVLAAPMLIGLDRFRQLANTFKSSVFIAHPSMTGTFFSKPSHGIEPGILLGKMFRMLGADASIFPNFGGRFSFTSNECSGIRNQLRAPLSHIKTAFPMPAGGMTLESLPSLMEDYGEDSIFLIGGAILGRPEGVEQGTRNFLTAINARYRERLERPSALTAQ